MRSFSDFKYETKNYHSIDFVAHHVGHVVLGEWGHLGGVCWANCFVGFVGIQPFDVVYGQAAGGLHWGNGGVYADGVL